MPVRTQIQIRRGTSAEWASGVDPLSQGEFGYDLTLKKIKIGDGSTAWNSLPWATILGSDLIGVSGIKISYVGSGSGLATVSVTGLSSSYISDFANAVSGLLPVKNIVAGNGVSISVSGDNAFIISTSGSDSNAVKDIIGTSVTGVSGVRVDYNNTSKITTISLSDPSIQAADVTDFNSSVSGLLGVKSLVAGTGIGIGNISGVQTISVTGIPSSLITDLGNIATTQVIGRTGILLTYDSINDTMFIDTTGVSLVGHTHTWSNISDASTRATLNELAYLSGVSTGTASANRAVVLDSNRNITGLGSVSTTGSFTVGGNLTVNGVTTTVNSTTVDIGDNIIRVNVSGANTQGGLEVRNAATSGVTQLVWDTDNSRWQFNNGNNVYTSGYFIGSLSGNANTVTNGLYTSDSGTITSLMIANNTIVDADINSSASISYSKLNLGNSITNSDISSTGAIAYSKLNLGNSITNSDISSSGNIAVNKLASSGVTIGSTSIYLGGTTSTIAGLASISGTSTASPTILYNCAIDGGTP
jgi:hypothetical protein